MSNMLEQLLEREAKKKWNSEVDEDNRWDTLNQEEKDELISAEKRRAVLRRKLSKKSKK